MPCNKGTALAGPQAARPLLEIKSAAQPRSNPTAQPAQRASDDSPRRKPGDPARPFFEKQRPRRSRALCIRAWLKPSRKSSHIHFEKSSTRRSRAGPARRFALDPRALQDWEQGRRRPDRAARAYLTVIARHPEAVVEALASLAAKSQAKAQNRDRRVPPAVVSPPPRPRRPAKISRVILYSCP